MIKIYDMTLEDFDSIKDVLQIEFDDFWTKSILKSELENKNSKYIIAKENSNIVGFAGILISPDIVEITNIVTKKNERKKGIGSLLLEKIIEMAEKTDKPNINLEVNSENCFAINLYKKFGFEQIGLRKKYYNGKNDAIIMSKRLIHKV